MAAKFFTVLASLALVNTIAACPYGAPALSAWPAANIGGCGLGSNVYNGAAIGRNVYNGAAIGSNVYNGAAIGNGGGLGVTSVSALAPNGISVLSENAIDGFVDVTGAVPLLAAVAFEGNLPTAGAAGTAYSCGNGDVGISAESLAAAGLAAGAAPATLGLGAANFGNAFVGAEIAGFNAGLAASGVGGTGCGIGNIWY